MATLDSQFHMPGAFHSDGVHPGIFRPPSKSPRSATSSGYLPSRTTTDENIHNTAKRKRLRNDTFSSRAPVMTAGDEDLYPSTPHRGEQYGGAWQGRHYVLAGQLDTPGGDGTDMMGESMFSDSDYRRMLGTKRPCDDPTTLGGEPLRSIFPPSTLQQQSSQLSDSSTATWGSFAVSTLGGVVGRIWQFCTAGSFKGFQAGGGTGYEIKPSMEEHAMFQDDLTPYELRYEQQQYRRNHPGYFPEQPAADPTDPYEAASRSSSPAAPAAKRRQTAAPADELGRNWVMVDKSGGAAADSPARRRNTSAFQQTAAAASPSSRSINRNHRPSVTTGRRISTPNIRRSLARAPSSASTPTINAPAASPALVSSASYASPRPASPTKIPTYSPSSSYVSSKNTRPTSSFSHRRTNSGASVASGRVSTANTSARRNTICANDDESDRRMKAADASPRLSAEAKKLAARRRREDDEADYRMSALNKQLQDMIKQGKEALGTRIEVDMDVDVDAVGGWEDEDYP
jgi:hypothetical protein